MKLKTFQTIIKALVDNGEAKDLNAAAEIAAPLADDGYITDGDKRLELKTLEWKPAEPGKCARFAAEVRDLIDDQVSAKRTRAAIVKDLATAAKMEEDEVEEVLDMKMDGCPSMAMLEGFAAVLDADVNTLKEAAMAAGCVYKTEGDMDTDGYGEDEEDM